EGERPSDSGNDWRARLKVDCEDDCNPMLPWNGGRLYWITARIWCYRSEAELERLANTSKLAGTRTIATPQEALDNLKVPRLDLKVRNETLGPSRRRRSFRSRGDRCQPVDQGLPNGLR